MKLLTLVTLIASWGAVSAARFLVRVAPGQAIRWASSRPSVDERRRGAIDSMSYAVGTVGRLTGATCLDQAIALTLILSVIRVPARLVIGVERGAAEFGAHAWVESNGRVILGAAEASRYAALPLGAR